MTQLVINLSRVTQQVGIIDDQGRKTSFRLMARGRVETEYDIDPNWMAHNHGAIRVVPIDPPVDTTQKNEPEAVSSTSKAAKKQADAETPAEGAK